MSPASQRKRTAAEAIEVLGEHDLAYAVLPFRRDQDIIRVITGKKGVQLVACVVDGWNNPAGIKGNEAGRKAAEYVAGNFPETFLAVRGGGPQERAKKAAKIVDQRLLEIYSAHASCVGAFLFSFKREDVIVAVGSVVVLLWNGKRWEKPKEIGDYSLDPAKYPSDVSRFFGRGELKGDPFYSAEPDVVVCSAKKPVFLASDGLEDVLTINYLNKLTQDLADLTPKAFITSLCGEVQRRQKAQRDDISILLKGPF